MIQLDMIGIIANDMKKSIDFYRTLGLNIPSDLVVDQYYEINEGGVRLSFNSKEMVAGIYGTLEAPKGQRLELAFLCDDVPSLNEKHIVMKEAGYTIFKEPWDTFWGQRYCIIEDCDGNLVSLFCPLENNGMSND